MGCRPEVAGKSKSRGAAPHADYFLYAAKESNQRKAAPVCRPLRGFPALLDRSGLLINSHDPLRGHVLKHIRQNSLTSLRYSVADEGKKSINLKPPRGHFVPTLLDFIWLPRQLLFNKGHKFLHELFNSQFLF